MGESWQTKTSRANCPRWELATNRPALRQTPCTSRAWMSTASPRGIISTPLLYVVEERSRTKGAYSEIGPNLRNVLELEHQYNFAWNFLEEKLTYRFTGCSCSTKFEGQPRVRSGIRCCHSKHMGLYHLPWAVAVQLYRQIKVSDLCAGLEFANLATN